MLSLLKSIGVEVERADSEVILTARSLTPENLSAEAVGRLRGSILLLGALLGRLKEVRLPRPGGDIIGARPIDVHLDAFRQLGAEIREEAGDIIYINSTPAKAGRVVLREFSVTATENILMLAATLPGMTTIDVAATEPHVVALAELLNAMGARITGAGTHTIVVEGTPTLTGADFTNIPDMLEAGLFILMAAATRSPLRVEQVPIDDLQLFFKKLDDIGIKYTLERGEAAVIVEPAEKLAAFKMQSLPHPGIPTDLQAPFAVLATQARGTSLIHDPLYEDRFKHIVELQKMGARAVICDPHRVVVEGPQQLTGRTIPSLDIRSGATLIMAGLVAQGETIIQQAEIIERGYARLVERLQAIGAQIRRQETG
jgi:UDP-N-acetylglucosamine 1-carboxyvinyltransferase